MLAPRLCSKLVTLSNGSELHFKREQRSCKFKAIIQHQKEKKHTQNKQTNKKQTTITRITKGESRIVPWKQLKCFNQLQYDSDQINK